MNIYFVSRKSRIKGPSEITDSSRRRIISVGDFCVREREHGIELLWIVQDNMSSWSACLRVAFTSTSIACEANTLLFAYDGASLRHGNLALLQKLFLVFEGNAHDFFQNAIGILTYKEDCWDAQIFQSFHKSVHILEESLSNNVRPHVEDHFNETLSNAGNMMVEIKADEVVAKLGMAEPLKSVLHKLRSSNRYSKEQCQLMDLRIQMLSCSEDY